MSNEVKIESLSIEERSKLFNKDVSELLNKYQVAIYAANAVVNKEGDVAPVIRIIDNAPKKENANTTEARDLGRKETQ